MTWTVIILTGVALMMNVTSSIAYPFRYHSPQPYYYQPEFDPMDYYNPYVDSPVQSRSFADDYYQRPYEVQWPDLVGIYGQWPTTKGQQRQQIEMRHNADAVNARQDEGEPIPGAFLVPANVNGAFAGPLAVIPAHYGGAGAVTNSGSPGAQYLAIIDGPNWPFIGRPKTRPKTNSLIVKKSEFSDTDYVPVEDGPNWPYIGVNSPSVASRSSEPMDYNEQQIVYESYLPIDYMYNPSHGYLYHNY